MGQNPLSYYTILCNESEHNILAFLVGLQGQQISRALSIQARAAGWCWKKSAFIENNWITARMVKVLQYCLHTVHSKKWVNYTLFLLLSFACRRTLQSIQQMSKLHFVFVAFLLLAEEWTLSMTATLTKKGLKVVIIY